MTLLPSIITGLMGCLISTGVMAADEYVCTNDQHVRKITVIYKNANAKVPCEVTYQKKSVTKVLWRAESKAGYCESKAVAFALKQESWGWSCEKVMPPSE
jgi:hypothetical protein